jgi:hypothetical protein
MRRTNHDEDQTGDCRARDSGVGLRSLCCRSKDARAFQEPHFNDEIGNFSVELSDKRPQPTIVELFDKRPQPTIGKLSDKRPQ